MSRYTDPQCLLCRLQFTVQRARCDDDLRRFGELLRELLDRARLGSIHREQRAILVGQLVGARRHVGELLLRRGDRRRHVVRRLDATVHRQQLMLARRQQPPESLRLALQLATHSLLGGELVLDGRQLVVEHDG